MKLVKLAIGTCIFTILWASSATANLTVCNKTEHEIRIAIIAKFWNYYQSTAIWKSSGWFHLSSEDCDELITGQDATQAFFSVLTIRDDHEPYLIPVEPAAPDDIPWAEGVSGTAEIFCIPEGQFTVTKPTLNSYERCGANEHKQLFNMFAAVNGNQHLTFDITAPPDPE